MKPGYLKEILKTTAKIALIAGVTAVAAPYAFGFAVGFFNMMAAGYVAGTAVTAIGAVTAVKTLVKDVVTMRERVKKQQRDAYVDEQLENLNKEVKKMRPDMQPAMTRLHTNQTRLHTNQKGSKAPVNKTPAKGKKRKLPDLVFHERKRYDRAA